MRFFRHGDVLAITLPESLRKKFDVKEGDDYEFVEVEKGFFALVTKEKTVDLFKREALSKGRLPAPQPPAFIPAASLQKAAAGFKASLQSKGFLVLETEEQAKAASAELEKDIKTGAVRGVRGFDKKFYLATREFFESNAAAIQKALGKYDLTSADVSQSTKLSLDATLTVLYLLKEEGELIEKKRGMFSLVK